MEEWRPIEGYQKYYEVSNLGRVRSMRLKRGQSDKPRNTPLILSQRELKHGNSVTLSGNKTMQVHVLVLEHFMEPRPDEHEARHIDGDKTNNRVENLEWVHRQNNPTRKERVYESTYIPVPRRIPGESKLRLVDPTPRELTYVHRAALAYGRAVGGEKLPPEQTAYAIINECRPDPVRGDARWHALCSLAVALWEDNLSQQSEAA